MWLHTFLDVSTALLGVWYFSLTARLIRFYDNLEYLKDVWFDENRTALWPKVSLIIPACNEGETIFQAASSLLKIDYPALEIVLIDDRSTDNTNALIKKLALSEPRIKVVEIKTLPPGWLGKVHALNEGVKAATGEWLLFTDADVHFRPEALKRALSYVEKKGLDFLTISPRFIMNSFWLKIFVNQFLHQGAVVLDQKRLSDPNLPDALGIGAFNLVRRSTFDSSEGFEGLKMEVVDDSGLAFLIKKAGGRLGLCDGMSEIEIEWYPNLRGFIRGLEKNGFAMFQYSMPNLLTFIFLTWALLLSSIFIPPLAPSPFAQIFFVTGALSYFLYTAYAFGRWARISPLMVLWLPITFVLFPLISLRSAFICHRQNGISWRGVFYSLDEIRRGQRFKPLDGLFKK